MVSQSVKAFVFSESRIVYDIESRVIGLTALGKAKIIAWSWIGTMSKAPLQSSFLSSLFLTHCHSGKYGCALPVVPRARCQPTDLRYSTCSETNATLASYCHPTDQTYLQGTERTQT